MIGYTGLECEPNEDTEALEEYSEAFAKDLEWYDVIDELENRGFDVAQYIASSTGMDADIYDNDAHRMANEVLKVKDNNLGELRRILAEYIFEEGWPEPDYDTMSGGHDDY